MKGKKLIFLPNWVGDFLMAFAWLDTVLERREDVLLFGKPKLYQLIRGKYSRGFWIDKDGFWINLWRLFKSDAVEALLLPNSFSSALLTTLAGLKTTGIPADGRGFLLNRKIFVQETLHQSEVYARLFEAFGFKLPEKSVARIYLSQEDRYWAEDLISSLGWKNLPIFVMHPGASKPERCWPVERFGEVARLMSLTGFAVAVVGGGKEGKKGEYIEKCVEGPFFNLAALNVPLGRLAAFIERASIFLGNDSGPLHVAAALGLRCVGIYGTSIPEKTGPVLGEGAVLESVASRLPCSPCRERFFKECTPVNNVPPCIDAISVEQVLKAIERLLS